RSRVWSSACGPASAMCGCCTAPSPRPRRPQGDPGFARDDDSDDSGRVARDKVGGASADKVEDEGRAGGPAKARRSRSSGSGRKSGPAARPEVPEDSPPEQAAAEKPSPPDRKPAAKKAAAGKDAAGKDTAAGGKATAAKKAPAIKQESSPAKATGAKQADSAGKEGAGKEGKDGARKETSLTARQAAAARAALQRGHRRIAFARAVAFGAELAGAAGLVVAGLLPWAWTDRLWGRTDGLAVAVQTAIGVPVLAPIGARTLRTARWRTAARTLAQVAAAVATVLSVASVWQVAAGGRGGGGLVAGVAGLLVIAGSAGWLVGLRRLRKLFAFGVRYARTGGYGNLSAVRRAQVLGAPLGVLGAAAVGAGGVLVAPGLVSSEDAQTAEALTLTGPPPSIGSAPTWEIELPAGLGRTTVRATPGGLAVDEQRGVRMVDPHSGETRWHWRDEAYTRVAVNLADSGRI